MNKKSINQNQLLNNSTMFNQFVEKMNQILINVFFLYVNVLKRQSMYRWNILLNVFNYPINQKRLSINNLITQCIQWHAVNKYFSQTKCQFK